MLRALFRELGGFDALLVGRDLGAKLIERLGDSLDEIRLLDLADALLEVAFELYRLPGDLGYRDGGGLRRLGGLGVGRLGRGFGLREDRRGRSCQA